jgi:hypothetical protein
LIFLTEREMRSHTPSLSAPGAKPNPFLRVERFPWVPGAQVLLGGYLSWQDRESNSWWQETWFDGGAPKIVRLGPIDQRTGISQPRIQFLALMEDWFPRYSPNTVGEPFNGIEPPLLPEVTAQIACPRAHR